MKVDKPGPPGLLESLRMLGDGLLASVQDRVALLGIELQEEKLRLIQLLVWFSAAMVTGVMVLVLGSLTLVVIFWDSARVAVLVGLTVVYVVLLTVIVVRLRRLLTSHPLPFAASLTELEADRQCIRSER